MQRRLAAILSADVAGYSRLMGADELATVRTLSRHVPPAVPAIVFLSGGQDHVLATEHLSTINRLVGQKPWTLSFSYGRALQAPPLKAWKGAAAVAAGLLAGQALAFPPFAGATLVLALLRRRHPQWVASRLLARIAGSLVAILLVVAVASPAVRADRWLMAAIAALAGVVAWSLHEERLAALQPVKEPAA